MRSAGSLYLIFIGLLFCGAGAVFTWLMWRSYERAAAQREWAEVPCEIIESRVEERRIGAEVETEYRFAVLYAYRIGKEAHTSERYSLQGSSWSSSIERAEALVANYKVGSPQACFVDPVATSMAVLKRDSKAPGYFLWFSILIVVGGLGIMIGAVRSWMRGGREGGRRKDEG